MADTDVRSSDDLIRQESIEDDVFYVEEGLGDLEIDEEYSAIPSWLRYVESPFNWLPRRFSDVPAKEVIAKATERIEMDEGFDTAFPFEKFVRLLTLAYEFSHQGSEGEVEAWRQLTLCDQLIEEERGKDVASSCDKMSGALTHAIQATRAHLHLRSNNTTQARQTVEGIQPVSAMSQQGQATVQAMKARFFYHYRSRGARLAVQHARQALALAPDEPLWQVLTAEAIRRLRKFLPGTDHVTNEEVSLLESAVGKQRNARHLVLLAQAYRESGDSMFKKHRSEPDFFHSQTFHDISDMQAKAFELYKEALSLRPDYEVVNRLCGYGLLKLPAFKSDYRLAELCLQKALEQSPNNPTAIHSLGLYYYKGLMEYEKAALFCEKAGKLGNFPASLDMLRMKRLVYGNNYDPVFDFDKLLKQYGDDQTKRHEVLCQMGSYYLFFERNLTKALEYFRILLNEKAELSIMTSHKCTFLNMACKINLFECIVNEGTLLLQAASSKEDEESTLNDVKVFLEELKVTNPELFGVPANKNLIDDLQKISDDINQTYIRKKERRDSAKEKRRESLGRRRSSLEDNQTFRRRHSEGGANVPWRGSGNVNETIQNRTLRNTNSFSYKKRSSENFLSQVSVDEVSQGGKSSTSNQKRMEFQNKSASFPLYSKSTNYRRRSSGNISDVAQSRSFRNPYVQSYKQQLFESGPTHISESIIENSNETQNSVIRKQNKTNGFQNWTSKSGSVKTQFRQYSSWSGSSTTEKPEVENWRRKDDKDTNLAPP